MLQSTWKKKLYDVFTQWEKDYYDSTSGVHQALTTK